jgi:UDP-glucose 4-epimerase
MKIIVTGAAGLIGSHLVDLLLRENHEVIAIDNLSFSDGSNLSIDLLEIDLAAQDADKLIPDADIICHLAAYKKAPKNSIYSSDVMSINFSMMHNVLKYCKESNAKLLFTSTSDVYGNSNTFVENEPLLIGPPNVERYSYALSKLHDEQLVLNMVNEKQVHACIARIFGCASPRSNKGWSGGHVPMFIDKAIKGEDIIIHGDGLQTRSMSHALDIAEGLSNMVSKLDILNGEIINIGTDEETTVKECAEYIVSKTNSTSKIIYVDQTDAFGNYREIKRRWANTSKAKLFIGYKVKYKTFEVIDEIIEAFKNEYSSSNSY